MISDNDKARVRLAHDKYVAARSEWERASANRREVVRSVAARGVSASKLARVLGISRAQVRQLLERG